ncbi:MAG: PPC domain-containing protein [Anaerolineae bacterium]|nr:PPC domain-containing protein [Anaerolineae bacterium]
MLASRVYRFVAVVVVMALVVALAPAFARVEAAGGVVAYGDSVTGQITNQTYYELWQFAGSRGDRVQITMTGEGGLDPYLGLIELASEEVLIEDDDSAGNSNAMIEFTLPSSGDFVIVATRYDLDAGKSVGNYTLDLAGGNGPQNQDSTNISNTPSVEPVELEPGVFYMGDLSLAEPMAGAISNDSYAQLYTVTIEEPTAFVMAMFAAEDSNVDPYLIFATEGGDLLAEDDDSGADVGGTKTDSFIGLEVEQPGTYYIIATRSGIDAGKTAGEYVLIAGVPEGEPDEPAPAPEEDSSLPSGVEYLGPVDVGGSASGAITDDVYINLYTFSGDAGEMVTITMTGEGDLDTYLGIIDSNDEVIAEDDDSGGGYNAQIALRLPESGTYVIVATRNGLEDGTTTGSYTLDVTSGPPPATDDTTTSTVGGFGGLPGRAVQTDDGGTLWLRGSAPSDDPAKGSGLNAVCATDNLPGRGGSSACYGPVVNGISLNFEEIK